MVTSPLSSKRPCIAMKKVAKVVGITVWNKPSKRGWLRKVKSREPRKLKFNRIVNEIAIV